MANFVDSLLIQLGFDTTELVKGQREASASFKKTKDEVQRNAKDIDASTKAAGESVATLARNFLTLFALVSGTKSMVDFAKQIGVADFAIARLATNLNSTPERFSAMTTAVERNGGSAEAAAGSFAKLSNSFEELKTTGNTGILVMLQRLAGEGGHAIDMLHGFDGALPGIIANLEAVKRAKGQAHAIYMAESIGLDPGTASLMVQGKGKWNSEVEKSKQLGVVTKEAAEAAGVLLEQWRSLKQALEAVGRSIDVALAPYLSKVVGAMTAWVAANKEWLGQNVAGFVEGFGNVIKNVADSDEYKSFVSAMSNPKTWQPFLDFVHQAGSNETWQQLKATLNWFREQLKEIRDIWKVLMILTSKGFANGEDFKKLWHDYDVPKDEPSAASPSSPIPSTGGAESGNGGILGGLRRRFRQMTGRGGGDAHPRPGKVNFSNPNAQAAIEELRKAGYNDNAIAAVVGSMQTESSFNPRAHNSVAGGHTGAWQWDSTRWPKVAAWITSQGGDPYDFRWQARAWVAEHNAKPGDAIYDNSKTEEGGRLLRGNPSLPNAIHGVRLSERFGAGEEGGRAANAGNWLPHLTKPAPAPPVISKPGTALPQFHSGTPPMVGWHETIKAVKEAGKPIPIETHRGLVGLRGAAARANSGIGGDTHNNSTSSHEVHVGHVSIHPPNGDPDTIARSIKPAIERHSFLRSNYGPA